MNESWETGINWCLEMQLCFQIAQPGPGCQATLVPGGAAACQQVHPALILGDQEAMLSSALPTLDFSAAEN